MVLIAAMLSDGVGRRLDSLGCVENFMRMDVLKMDVLKMDDIVFNVCDRKMFVIEEYL